jgi:hypothetical protein
MLHAVILITLVQMARSLIFSSAVYKTIQFATVNMTWLGQFTYFVHY